MEIQKVNFFVKLINTLAFHFNICPFVPIDRSQRFSFDKFIMYLRFMPKPRETYSPLDALINQAIEESKSKDKSERLNTIIIQEYLGLSRPTLISKRKAPITFSIDEVIKLSEITKIPFKALIDAIYTSND